jgi:hypothetical protein
MRADEQYASDYLTLAAIKYLHTLQRKGEHDLFADCMDQLWRMVSRELPPDTQRKLAVLAIDAYFGARGDLGRALREHEGTLVRLVGYTEHYAAASRMEAKLDEVMELLRPYAQG